MITLPGIYSLKGEGVLSIPNATSKNTMLIINLPKGVYAGKSISIKL